jgi:CRISPR-associated protein Csc2
MNITIKHLDQLKPYLCEQIPDLISARYVQLVVLRQLESHAIFTTEGDDLVTRKVWAGHQNRDLIPRLMMSNRKVIATERRLGKGTMRALGILPDAAGDACYLGKLCGKCVDCILLGFAAIRGRDKFKYLAKPGGELKEYERGSGNNNSRVLTDEAWSLGRSSGRVDTMTFNAINERTRGTGQALGDTDQILPETIFVNVTTLKAVTPLELMYWLYCTLFTRRYGADASRIGKMRNHIVGVVGSRAEALSSLDLARRFYDTCGETTDLATLKAKSNEVIEAALKDIGIAHHLLKQAETEELCDDFVANYTPDEKLVQWLIEANNQAIAYADRKLKAKPAGEEEEAVEAAEATEAEEA